VGWGAIGCACVAWRKRSGLNHLQTDCYMLHATCYMLHADLKQRPCCSPQSLHALNSRGLFIVPPTPPPPLLQCDDGDGNGQQTRTCGGACQASVEEDRVFVARDAPATATARA